MSSSNAPLERRINRMLAEIERQQATLVADEAETRLQDYAREGLNRKFALVAAHNGLPADYSEQCRAIDQDIERRMSPAERAARAAHQRKYTGAREQLLARLSMYAQNGEAA